MTKGHMKQLAGPFLKPVPEWLGLQRCSDHPQPYSPTSLGVSPFPAPKAGPQTPLLPQQQVAHRRFSM